MSPALPPIKAARELLPLCPASGKADIAIPGYYNVIEPSSYARIAPLLRDVEDHALPAPRTFMDTALQHPVQEVPALSVYGFKNVYTLGQGFIATPEFAVEETLPSPYEKLLRAQTCDTLAHALAALDIPRVKCMSAKPYVWLRKSGDTNYGHWLVELLPKTGLIETLSPELLRSAHFCIARHTPVHAIMLESLALAGVSPDRIIDIGDEPVHFETLIYPGPVTSHPLWKAPFVFEYLERMATEIPPDPQRKKPERLFVIREKQFPRQLLNQDAIAALLERKGFTVVSANGLGFKEQIRLFSRARVIVGVFGASMSNMLFAPRDSTVVLLTPNTVPAAFYWDIACHRKQRYVQLYGKTVSPERKNSDFTINPVMLEKILAMLGA